MMGGNKFRRKRQEKLEKLLGRLNYKLCRIDHDGKINLISSIGIHSDLTKCDYLCIPNELFKQAFNILNIMEVNS